MLKNVYHVCEVLLAGNLVGVKDFVSGALVVDKLGLRHSLCNFIIAQRIDEVIVTGCHDRDGNMYLGSMTHDVVMDL